MNFIEQQIDLYHSTVDENIDPEIQQKFEAGIHELINLVSNNSGLQYIVESISELFGHPASITDNNFTYLALSPSYSDLFLPLEGHSAETYIPIEIQKQLRGTKIFRPEKKRIEPVYFDTEFPDGSIVRNYATLIYLKQLPVASFSVFTDGSALPLYQLRHLPVIAALLNIELQKSNFYLLNKATYLSHLLAHLLDDSAPLSDDTYTMRFSVFGYQLRQYKQLIYVDLHNEFLDVAQTQSFAEKISGYMDNSVYFIRDEGIIYLSSKHDYVFDWDKKTEPLAHIIEATNIKVGISSIFESISGFSEALKQARIAIKTGKELNDNSVFWFDDQRLSCLASHLPKELDSDSWLFPPLMRVLAYDNQHDTQLAYTLQNYLLNPNHPKEVCADLSIHKNTLYYRLNQIRELMQCDIDSADIIAQIQITFTILNTQNRLKIG
jgi:sugar diacid utilization regulator